MAAHAHTRRWHSRIRRRSCTCIRTCITTHRHVGFCICTFASPTAHLPLRPKLTMHIHIHIHVHICIPMHNHVHIGIHITMYMHIPMHPFIFTRRLIYTRTFLFARTATCYFRRTVTRTCIHSTIAPTCILRTRSAQRKRRLCGRVNVHDKADGSTCTHAQMA